MFDDRQIFNAFLLVAGLSTLAVFGARLEDGFAPSVMLLRYGVLAWALYDLQSLQRRSRGLVVFLGVLIGWLGGDLDLVPVYVAYDPPSLLAWPARFVFFPCALLFLFAKILYAYL